MAASSQVFQNKRGRDDEYWNGGLALPSAKRTNSRRLVHDSDIMALLEKIDNMDAISTNPEETHTVTQLIQNERLLINRVMKSLQDEVGLKGQASDVDEKVINEMGSNKEGEITDDNSEASSASDTADMYYLQGNSAYYDDVHADLGFFVDHTAVELGFMVNLLDGNSMANLIYTDAVYGYTETVYGGSLWEDDIWQWNEHPVNQNVFASPYQEESGFSGAEFHNVWNDRPSATVEECCNV